MRNIRDPGQPTESEHRERHMNTLDPTDHGANSAWWEVV